MCCAFAKRIGRSIMASIRTPSPRTLIVDFRALHSRADTKKSWNALCAGVRLIEFRAVTLRENLTFPDGQRLGTMLAWRRASKVSTISCVCCAATVTLGAFPAGSKTSHRLPFALRHTELMPRHQCRTIARVRASAETLVRSHRSRRRPIVGIVKRVRPRAGQHEHSGHDLGLGNRVAADAEARAHGPRRYCR